MATSKTTLPDIASSFLFIDTDCAATAVAVAAASTVIYSIDVDNTANAAVTYLKLYNVASGSVTVGTTAPDMILLVPASTRTCFNIPQGVTFGTAVTMACLTAGGTAGSTGPTSDVIVRIIAVT